MRVLLHVIHNYLWECAKFVLWYVYKSTWTLSPLFLSFAPLILPSRRPTGPYRRKNSDFPEFCLKCLWTVSEGSDTTRKFARMKEGRHEVERRERETLSRGVLACPKGLRSRTLRSKLEGSHILSHGAVNLARTQIKFLAPAERKECVISLRLYERRRDQRSGNPGPPIRLIERNEIGTYISSNCRHNGYGCINLTVAEL